jgi:dipeptidyl aminopeptidase/acylaminoacyl peptidase
VGPVNRPYGKPGLLWLALGGAVWLACMSEASDVPAGRIEVVVTLTGAVAEPTDLALILDQRFRVALSGSGSAVFERVKGGPHRVTLVGVDARCGVRPGLERELVIAESDTIQVEFEITCSSTSGLLQLVTTITGSDHDPDGYTLLVDGEPRSRMEPSGVHQLTLPEGPHRLTLSGLSANCVVAGGNEQVVQVTAGRNTEVAFAVECSPVPRAGPGREIAFVSDRAADSLHTDAVYIMNEDGTQVRPLSDTLSRDHFRPAWSPDGARIAIVALTPTLALAITVATAEGALERQLRMEHEISSEVSWSPDAMGILFTTFSDEGCSQVIRAQADGGGETVVLSDEECPPRINAFSYSPDGRSVGYLRGDVIFGNVTRVVTELVIRDATTLERVEAPCLLPGASNGLSWSPDGTRLAIDAESPLASDLFRSEIWVMDLEAGTCTQITSGLDDGFSPAWSPDGSRIAFVSTRDGNPEIYVMNVDGADQRRLTTHRGTDGQPAWRP